MKLLIIRAAALGDTLMLMPAIALLRGSTEIALVGRSPGVDILSPYVNHSINYETSGWHRLFLENPDGDHAFSLREVDSIVAFLSDPDGTVNKNLKSLLPKTPVYFFPAFPPEKARIHAAFYLAQCLKSAGLPVDPGKCLEEASRRPLLKGQGQAIRRKKTVFHPGSGGKGKNYPPDFWLQLVRKIGRYSLNGTHIPLPPPFGKGGQGGFLDQRQKSIILLGPAEEELRPFFTERLSAEQAEILFAPGKDQLIRTLRQAPLYIGHDSGITHLAAMLGTPTIALFKNSPVHQWRPLGPAVRVIENEENRERLMLRTLEETSELIGGRHLSSKPPAK